MIKIIALKNLSQNFLLPDPTLQKEFFVGMYTNFVKSKTLGNIVNPFNQIRQVRNESVEDL